MREGFNEKQLEAIKSEEDKIIILAPPGSGKTWTMTGAIDYYLENNDVNHAVAVTFTRAAAEELKERVFNKAVHCSTIHSWSLTKLNDLSRKYSFRVKILQEENILAMLRPIMQRYGVSDRSKWLVYHFVMGNTNIDIFDNMKAKFKAIADGYVKEKRRRNVYDFTDLPLYLKTKLEDYDEYIDVDAIFVDEFQDVDPIQLEVFNRVRANKKFFIGDPDQAIYIFRGATANVFDKLKGHKIYRLDINYRSYQNIMNYATTFKNMSDSMLEVMGAGVPPGHMQGSTIKRSHISTIKGEGGTVISGDEDWPKLVLGNAKDKQNMARHIQESILNDKPQILCRKNKEVKELKELGYENVSTIHKAKGLEFNTVIMNNFSIEDTEDVNIAYVGITRAKNKIIVSNFQEIVMAIRPISRQLKEEAKERKKQELAF